MALEINTTAEETPMSIVALDAIKPDEMQPATEYESKELKLVDGKPVFRLGHLYAKDADDRPLTLSVRVFAKPEKSIPELSRIVLTGQLRFKGYVAQNGHLAWSVVADGVEAA